MNIDNGTSDDIQIGQEIEIKMRVVVTEIGRNFITVEDEDGEEIDILDSSYWWITL